MTIGFAAGVIAWLLRLGGNDRDSFTLTALLGAIAGVATALFGHALGWFQLSDTEALAGALLGAAIVLVLWVALAHHATLRK